MGMCPGDTVGSHRGSSIPPERRTIERMAPPAHAGGFRRPKYMASGDRQMPTLAQEVWTIPLFQDIPVEEREKLLKYAMVQDYPDGHVLFHEGSIVGQHMYVVLSGEVEILKRDKAGKNTVLASLRRGSFFGEMSLFEKERRSAQARVKGAARLLIVTNVNFDQMMKSDPIIANKMLLVFVKTLSERLRSTSDKYALEHEPGRHHQF